MPRKKTPGADDFEDVYNELLVQIATHASKLPAAQLDMKIDAAKVLTAAKSVKNRTPEDDDGAEIRAFREQLSAPANTEELLEETDEPDESEAA